jgi:hypothetical protein
MDRLRQSANLYRHNLMTPELHLPCPNCFCSSRDLVATIEKSRVLLHSGSVLVWFVVCSPPSLYVPRVCCHGLPCVVLSLPSSTSILASEDFEGTLGAFPFGAGGAGSWRGADDMEDNAHAETTDEGDAVELHTVRCPLLSVLPFPASSPSSSLSGAQAAALVISILQHLIVQLRLTAESVMLCVCISLRCRPAHWPH